MHGKVRLSASYATIANTMATKPISAVKIMTAMFQLVEIFIIKNRVADAARPTIIRAIFPLWSNSSP